MVIKDRNDYKDFCKHINGRNVYIDYVVTRHNQHIAVNDVFCLFVGVCNTAEVYYFNFYSQDVVVCEYNKTKIIDDICSRSNKIFVTNKKRFIQLFNTKNVNDILIYEFQSGYEQKNDEEFSTPQHNFIYTRDFNGNSNYIIPFMKHIQMLVDKYNYYKESIEEFVNDISFKNLNGVITETLADIERNGLFVDNDVFDSYFSDKRVKPIDNKVYTEYNIFTSTGRPSNHYGGINYAALNKENGCRKSFVSRFGRDGLIVTMDYSAYHPRIIANLVNYKDISMDTSIYEYLGQYYFNKSNLNENDIKESKKLTFLNLYGGVRDEFKEIPYFKAVDEYINHRWDFFNKHGYVETPVFHRRITDKHILEPNKNKLFNYILQASETEFSIKNISGINEYLKDKCSKVILYTYDSLTFDVCKEDGIQVLKEIKKLMVDNKFAVKCYAGKNYDEQQIITF